MTKDKEKLIMQDIYKGLSLEELRERHDDISKRAVLRIVKKFNPDLYDIIKNPDLRRNYSLIMGVL